MRYSLSWLIDLQARSETLDYLFFGEHQPRADGQVGSSCLSQRITRTLPTQPLARPKFMGIFAEGSQGESGLIFYF